MFRNPLLKKRILQVVGIVALALVLVTAFLGCMLTESLAVTIGSLPDAPARGAMVEPPAGAAAAVAAAASGAPGSR